MTLEEALIEAASHPKSQSIESRALRVLASEVRALKLITCEYQQLMNHMDAGGDFFKFQRDREHK